MRLLSLFLAAVTALPLFAADPAPRDRQLRDALRARADALGCPGTLVWAPVTVYSEISESSCMNSIDLRTEVFDVHLREGDLLDVDFSSPDFEVYLFMNLGGGRSGPDRRASPLTSGVSRVTMRYLAEETRTYEIEAMHLYPLDFGEPVTGRYTLRITSSGNNDCTPPTPFGPPPPQLIAPGSRAKLTPHLIATEPITLQWFPASSLDGAPAFTGWPFLTPPVTTSMTWWYRASNACGTRVEPMHVTSGVSRRRAVAR
jgi:hypothetical protein